MSPRSRKVSTTPLTPHLGFTGNLRLEKWLRQVKGARRQTAADRLRKADRRTWKVSQFPAGLGNHAVIYKLCLTPHLTWPLSFYCHSTRPLHERRAACCFITCYNWANDKCSVSVTLQLFYSSIQSQNPTSSLCLGHLLICYQVQMLDARYLTWKNKIWKCSAWWSLMSRT